MSGDTEQFWLAFMIHAEMSTYVRRRFVVFFLLEAVYICVRFEKLVATSFLWNFVINMKNHRSERHSGCPREPKR